MIVREKIGVAWLTWPGDPAVGIPERTITIKDNPLVDLTVFDEEDRSIVIAEFAKKLADAFEVIEDGRPKVMFDFEDEDRGR